MVDVRMMGLPSRKSIEHGDGFSITGPRGTENGVGFKAGMVASIK